MTGTFSGHLLHSYHTGQAMNLVTSGAMSFNSLIHGTPIPSTSILGSQIPFTANPYANETMSEETAKRIATLQVKLDQKLGPEYISQRQGPRGGPKLTYAEGWKMINLANEVFGFNGWSSSLVNVTTDFVDRSESGRYNVGVTAIIRVTLREGVYHEDIGYGTADNSPSKGQALDKVSISCLPPRMRRVNVISSWLKIWVFFSARRRQSQMVLNVHYGILEIWWEIVFMIKHILKKSWRWRYPLYVYLTLKELKRVHLENTNLFIGQIRQGRTSSTTRIFRG